MNFTAKDVMALREKTGCGMMDCKKALTEADGNQDKAIELLREKGLVAAAKKASRIAAEGLVDIVIEGKTAAIIEVNSETDFVAKNAEFRDLVNGAAKAVVKYAPKDVEELKECKFNDGEFTVAEVLREKILKIGENMNIRRFERLEGNCVSYIHGGGSAGAIVLFDIDDSFASNEKFLEMGKNVCMQIVAMTPSYLDESEVDSATIEKEKEILIAQIKNDPKTANKPDQVIEKMVTGKISKFYSENCLINQAYVKDNKISVGKYIEDCAKEMGTDIKLKKFVMYEKGEGLQKREDNFADEVASMTK